MGNYYEYNIPEEHIEEWSKVKPIPDNAPSPFIDKDHINSLINESWTQSKRWDGVRDLCALSLLYPDLTLNVVIEDEDSDRVRLVAFQNGKFTFTVQVRYFEPLDFNLLQEPLTGEDDWNIRTIA